MIQNVDDDRQQYCDANVKESTDISQLTARFGITKTLHNAPYLHSLIISPRPVFMPPQCL